MSEISHTSRQGALQAPIDVVMSVLHKSKLSRMGARYDGKTNRFNSISAQRSGVWHRSELPHVVLKNAAPKCTQRKGKFPRVLLCPLVVGVNTIQY